MLNRIGATSDYGLLRGLTVGVVLVALAWSLVNSWQRCGWIDRLIGRTGCALTVASYAPNFSTFVAMSPSAPLLAVASANVVEIYEVPGGRLLRTLRAPGKEADAVAFSADGALLAAGSHTAIQVWEVADGTARHTFSVDRRVLADLAFAPDGRSLAAIDHGGQVWIWPLGGDQEPLWFTANDGGWNTRILFLPDGRLVSCAEDDPVRVWALPGGTLESEIAVDRCNGIAAANGALAIDADDSIQIWSLAEGRVIRSWEIDSNGNGAIAISPDGSMIAIGSGDDDVDAQLWRTSDGQLLQGYSQREQNSGAAVMDIAFSGDGRYMATNGAKHPISSSAVNVWRVGP